MKHKAVRKGVRKFAESELGPIAHEAVTKMAPAPATDRGPAVPGDGAEPKQRDDNDNEQDADGRPIEHC